MLLLRNFAPVTPFPATLTFCKDLKPSVCHSYANMGGGPPSEVTVSTPRVASTVRHFGLATLQPFALSTLQLSLFPPPLTSLPLNHSRLNSSRMRTYITDRGWPPSPLSSHLAHSAPLHFSRPHFFGPEFRPRGPNQKTEGRAEPDLPPAGKLGMMTKERDENADRSSAAGETISELRGLARF